MERTPVETGSALIRNANAETVQIIIVLTDEELVEKSILI